MLVLVKLLTLLLQYTISEQWTHRGGGGGCGHAICLTVEFVLFSSFKPYNWGGTELSTMESLSTFWNVFALYVTPTTLEDAVNR